MVLKADSTTHFLDVDVRGNGWQQAQLQRYVSFMPTKRKSRGRSKGQKGRSSLVQCASCGQLVPRDKAKKSTRRVTLVDPVLGKELRQKGAYLPSRSTTKYYCISCAVHRGIVKVRSKDSRKRRRRR
jgi:small subunit ribosomal protein S26e